MTSQVCNLVWPKNVNELVSTHEDTRNQVFVWRYPTMSKVCNKTILNISYNFYHEFYVSIVFVFWFAGYHLDMAYKQSTTSSCFP
jgi:hypothetical protein